MPVDSTVVLRLSNISVGKMGDDSFHTPPKLDIHDPNLAHSIKRWKRELQVYKAATEKDQKPANTQAAIILNCAGAQFIKMYDQFTWENDDDKLLPTKVMTKLERYCAPKGNVVVNSFRFWNAERREPFDMFLTIACHGPWQNYVNIRTRTEQ